MTIDQDVEMVRDCILWDGPVGTNGYGAASVKGKNWKAHRLVYVREVGPIPEGYEVDHLCRVRLCVNPAHLEAVTPTENRRRQGAVRTTCRKGHPLDGVRDDRTKGQVYRYCSTCRRESKRRWVESVR